MNRYKKISLLTFAVMIIALSMFLIINSFSAEEQDIASPSLTTENYTVFITEANNITYIRYASGEYTSSSDIKNAPDCVTLSASVIKANTTDGILAYEMPDGGVYSFWVKTSEGEQYIFSAVDMTFMTPEVSTYGVNITVSNVYGAYDLFIAKGTWSTYSEIKENGYIVRVREKLAGAKSCTYTVKDEGNYTVLVRYNDRIWHDNFAIDCINPTFSVNGLQLTVGNLKDVKCIRTAYGEYSTISEIKKEDTNRVFTAKGVIKGLDKYTIQYRHNGAVTVVVQYENGYYEFFYHNIEQKLPTLIQNNNIITFKDLDSLAIIRYAKGEYSTVSEIKAAADSQYLKDDAVVNGAITLTLEPGTYTFYVQFSDESQKFYIITAEQAQETEWGFAKMNQYTDESGAPVDTLPYWLYTPQNATEDMPLIVVLHSAHVKSKTEYTWEENLDRMFTTTYNDLPKYIYNGEFGDIPAYIVMPQTGSDSLGWAARGKEIAELVEFCEREYKTDSNRVSIIGYSLGGTGAVEIASAYPDIFSRVLSVAGGLDGVTNNIRPYIQNVGRIELSDIYYPELRVLKTDSTAEYEKNYMKYLYESNQNKLKYLAQTAEETAAAEGFKAERINAVAKTLNNGELKVWSIIGTKDAEVEPSISKDLCDAIGSGARCDLMEDYSHSKILPLCLEKQSEILDFILN